MKTVASTPGTGTIQSVVGDEAGHLYAAATDPDHLLEIDPALTPCREVGLEPGDQVQLVGMSQQTEILDRSCARRIVPNQSTLQAIQQTYHVLVKPPLPPSVYQRLAAGQAIPDSTGDPHAFQESMQDIFGTLGATVSRVVGTGTSGYNGTTDDFGLLPGTKVQIDRPAGLALQADGSVLFADSGNALVRAFVPSGGHVVDLGGLVADDGTPQAGFNGDGYCADRTRLDQPLAVSATGRARTQFVVADTGNARIRLLGPYPLDEAPVIPGAAATCAAAREAAPPPPARAP